ncbi:MAG TPA: hypothetical protein VK032_01990 [Burkholderiaceae bacterium]|nr:hypothetical protein [Burkholderiaceae bacterium]
MQIVLPGALPHPAAASQLADYLLKKAPTFVNWLAKGKAQCSVVDARAAGCTALEYWQLQTAGFQPHENQPFSAGLGPLNAVKKAPNGQAIWLAELVHLAATQEGAVLLPAQQLSISQEQSVALFASAKKLFADTGFNIQADSVSNWQIQLPENVSVPSISPALVSTTTVNDWWPHEAASRPWRQLFNELQMLWFNDPVNAQRQAAGLPAINALWLYGGATAAQLKHPERLDDVTIYRQLDGPSRHADWGVWLDELQKLENEVFAPLAKNKAPELVLLGEARWAIVHARPFWSIGALFSRQSSWRNWWSNPD